MPTRNQMLAKVCGMLPRHQLDAIVENAKRPWLMNRSDLVSLICRQYAPELLDAGRHFIDAIPEPAQVSEYAPLT